MLDASGKIGPAVLKGATQFYGDFDQCLEVISDVSPVTGRVVKGDTCVVSFTPPSQLTSSLGGLPVSQNLVVSLRK